MAASIGPVPVPSIRTELPGPLGRALIEADERFTSPSYTRVYPLAVKRGEGAVIEDLDGNLFLDFTAGIAVCATGHCHPRVVAAIREQAGKLLHMSGTDFYYEPQAELARKLAEIFPVAPPCPPANGGEDGLSPPSTGGPGGGSKRVFFTNSGAEAVEAAFKLARWHTKRKRVIAFYGAFHGRTMGALSLTASKTGQRRGFGPFVPEVTHIDYPDPYRTPAGSSSLASLDDLESHLFVRAVAPEEVAAVFVEPIQGEGGYIVPPPEFHRRLKSLCEKHGILYVADEVQTGMGRTGKMFALEHWGIEPDILCLAKGIASGLPLGAIVARGDIMNWPPGSHASTFGGNPLSCVAALETIRLLEEGLMANAAEVGDFLLEKLRDLANRHPLIGDVRGKGLMIGVELVRDRKTKEKAVKERNDIVQRCFQKGLLLLGCGENSLRLCPPLVIDQEQAETAVRILDEALGEIEAPE
ncbi:MAG: acetyl ornithine aminotransferase family protein [Planctomycetales bacterium]